jgi:hypothetical protein
MMAAVAEAPAVELLPPGIYSYWYFIHHHRYFCSHSHVQCAHTKFFFAFLVVFRRSPIDHTLLLVFNHVTLTMRSFAPGLQNPLGVCCIWMCVLCTILIDCSGAAHHVSLHSLLGGQKKVGAADEGTLNGAEPARPACLRSLRAFK